MVYALLLFLLIVLLVLNFQLKLFVPSRKKLRILEYHSISTNGFEDQITISKEKLIEHFEYLKQNNYTTLWMSDVDEFRNKKIKLPAKSVVLTFDDGYLDNYTELLPLLKQYDFKAVCFLVFGRIGQPVDWNGQYADKSKMLMNKQQLVEIGSHIELGYHTFKHDNYTHLTSDEIEKDLQLCQEVIQQQQLTVFPALAYTYGRYFRKKGIRQTELFELLNKYGIKYALRIGNRVNSMPLKNRYLIQRIDIRGTDSIADFKKKVIFGRRNIF